MQHRCSIGRAFILHKSSPQPGRYVGTRHRQVPATFRGEKRICGVTDKQHSLAGQRGAARRHGKDEPADMDAQIYLARVERETQRLLADAPPLTDSQRRRLSELLPAVKDEP